MWWAPTKHNTAASPLHRLLFGRHPGQPQPDEQPAIPDDAALPGLLADWAGPAGGLIAIEAVSRKPGRTRLVTAAAAARAGGGAV